MRNGLYDLANAAFNIKDSLEVLPEFLDNIDDWRVCMRYYSCRGYLFTLNYYKDNPETQREDKEKVEVLINLGLFLSKIENQINLSNKTVLKEKMKEGLLTLQQESLILLRKEISRLHLKDILDHVQDKRGYLDNYLGVKKSQPNDISGFIINLL